MQLEKKIVFFLKINWLTTSRSEVLFVRTSYYFDQQVENEGDWLMISFSFRQTRKWKKNKIKKISARDDMKFDLLCVTWENITRMKLGSL